MVMAKIHHMATVSGNVNGLKITKRDLSFDDFLDQCGAFGLYQILVILITQLTYVTVSGSMLCTVFDNLLPKVIACDGESSMLMMRSFNGSKMAYCSCLNGTLESDFDSLLVHLNAACSNNYVSTSLSTAVMAGGVIGSIVFGYVADKFGRKPCLIICLSGCVGINILLPFVAYNLAVVLTLLLTLGFFSGGYLVVSVIPTVEATTEPWRMLCNCLHGWPFGVMAMSLIAYLTCRWDYYHLTLGLLGVPFIVAYTFLDESPRWLLQHGRVKEAQNILMRISRINRKRYDKSIFDNHFTVDIDNSGKGKLSYTYWNLVQDKTIFIPLLVLCYSWFSGGVISFGIYFDIGEMTGNIFLKTFLMGLLKGTTGVIPYPLSKIMGRKPILLTSICVTSFTSWGSVILYFIGKAEYMPVLAVIGISAIDPMWKVNHMMSVEMFPTVVRSMSRAVVNVSSRIASLLAPQVSYLSTFLVPLPFIIYGIMTFIHIVIVIFFLPETRHMRLPETLGEVEKQEPSGPFESTKL